MPRINVTDLHLNDELNKAPFLLAAMIQATDRNDQSYLRLTLRDKTGDILGMYWRVPPNVVEQLRVGGGVAVSGRVTEYGGQLQISINGIFGCALDEITDFLPAARRSQQEMVDELQRLINSIQNAHLKKLLKETLGEDDFQKRFLLAPAAKTYHHACIGGLLEHSLDVARQVLLACKRYPEIDRDLAATVALLHDVGKVDTYALRGDFQFTDQGRLLGHIYMGAARAEQAINRIDGFPEELRLRILHAILAHHGDLEKGSPVKPCTPEAIALHYADNLDSSLRGWVDYVEREQTVDGTWTTRSNMHGESLFVGNRPSAKE